MVWACVKARAVLLGLVVAAVAAALGALAAGRWHRGAGATAKPDDDVLGVLEQLLAERADALVSLHDAPLQRHYDLDSRHGRWALEHEQRRIRYLQAWTRSRGLRLVSAAVKFRVARVKEDRGGEAWVSLVQSARLGYVYDGDASRETHLFGIGTRHAIHLVRQQGRWLVRRDWYTDPLDEDTLVPEVTPADVTASEGLVAPLLAWQRQGRPRCSPPGLEDASSPGQRAAERWTAVASAAVAPAPPSGVRYDREAAVRYAHQFCGAAWGCGNGGRYNPQYRDYTDVGGDCTNFTSQVLHAGGLPMTSVWHYRAGAGGSRAWVQTEALARYLLASGRARLLARGTYPQVVRGSGGRAPIDRLEPGDVIGYEEKGRIVHLAPVTGRDFRGYVVVNSHTADRYRVPWDVGWDRETVFWLFKVRDGQG